MAEQSLVLSPMSETIAFFSGACVTSRTSLALILFLSILNSKAVNGVWRYDNVWMDERLYTIGLEIRLQYFPPNDNITFYGWTASPGCEIDDIYSPSTSMRCNQQEYHSVWPNTNIMEERREIFISKSLRTFVWYAVIPEEEDHGMTKTMRIWVIDPKEADIAEIQLQATVPSQQSYYLSRHFYNLGQFPGVKLPSSPNRILGKFSENGYWEAELEWDKASLTAEIDGQSISFQHRFVLDGSHTFYWEPRESWYYDGAVAVVLEHHRPTALTSDPCHPHRSIFMSSKTIIMTSDGYRNYTEMKIYLPFYDPLYTKLEITDAILLEDGIILQIRNSLFWRSHQTRELEVRGELNIPDVQGMTQRTTCLEEHPQKDNINFRKVLIWTRTLIYIGGNRLNTPHPYLELVVDMEEGTSVTSHIWAVTFASDPVEIAVLYQVIGDIPRLYYFFLDGRIHRASSFLSSINGGMPIGNLHMRSYESAKETILLWNETTVWTSFYDETDIGTLTIDGRSDLAFDTTIHEVIVDKHWNLLVKLQNNFLYFTKYGNSKMVPMHSWILETSQSSIYLNDNIIKFISVNPISHDIEIIVYPLNVEKLSAMRYTDHDCPYVTFTHSMNKHSYYMDKGQEEVFWAEVIYPEGKGVYVNMLKSHPELLDFHMSSDFEFVHSIFTVNVTISAKHSKDYTENYDELMNWSLGVQRVEIYPSILGNRCDLPKDRVSYFNVGCPPNRHVRVVTPEDIECEMNTFHNFTIPGSKFRDPQEEDMVVVYDWNHGCMLKLHYKSEFKPTLALYDGDKFVKLVDANFVVWELHGRIDYSYNTTMRQAGCLRESITWSSLIQQKPSTHLDDMWGPADYRSCFLLNAGLEGDLSQPYEILNKSFSNHMTFSQEDSAVYMFAARVVDPNFSFCDLTATFNVHTFGISKPKYEHLIPYVSLSFSFLTLCVLGYSYCRYVRMFRQLQIRQKYD